MYSPSCPSCSNADNSIRSCDQSGCFLGILSFSNGFQPIPPLQVRSFFQSHRADPRDRCSSGYARPRQPSSAALIPPVFGSPGWRRVSASLVRAGFEAPLPSAVGTMSYAY
eukprot:scaffold4633_cov115-Pinguiococcus_pyrenoidosus.AAC.1